MVDGRETSTGQPIPIATQVDDGWYCFSKQSPDEPQQQEIRLLCAGRERCQPGFHVSRTEYPCVLLEYVADGLGKLRVGNVVRDLYAGVVFAYGMDSPHDLWADDSRPMTKYFAAFELASSSDGAHLGIGTEGVRWTRDLTVMQALFDELIREGRQAGPLHHRITSLYLELLLLKARSAVPAETAKRSGSHGAYERVRKCIDENYKTVASLDELSQLSGVAPNYICRLFRKYDTETPHQCLIRHKLNHAAELLATTSRQVSSISREVGFEDPFYFSRAFKKRYGLAPSQFRRVDQ